MTIQGNTEAASRLSLALILGCLCAAPASAGEWTDPAGDVVEPSADIVAGSVTVFEGMVDLRVRLSAPAFAPSSTISWLLDTDENPLTGGPGRYPGVDAGVGLSAFRNSLSTCDDIGISASRGTADTSSELDHYEVFSYDPATYTIRIVVPLSMVSDDDSFHFIVSSTFGGSFGDNEIAPQVPDFGTSAGFFVSESGPFQPFAGSTWCTRETVSIDLLTKNGKDAINPKSHRLLPVAVLTTGSFDATTLADTWFSARFGATGSEAEPAGYFALEDVDEDGDLDLLLTFDSSQTGIQCEDQSATLKAYGPHRHGVQGTVSIATVGCN